MVVLTLKLFSGTLTALSFFPYKDRLNRSLMSKVVYKASCWDCDDFYIGKTKRRLHDRKTEHSRKLKQGSQVIYWKNQGGDLSSEDLIRTS